MGLKMDFMKLDPVRPCVDRLGKDICMCTPGRARRRARNRVPPFTSRAPVSTLALLAFLALSVPASAQVIPQPKMGRAVHGLDAAQLDLFQLGRNQFERNFSIPEGLGPGFNQTSCANCHSSPTVGGSGATSVTRFGYAEKGLPFNPLDHLGGSLLQAETISPGCQEFIPAISNVQTFRITTSTFGLGLLEAIPDADLIALEAAQAQPGSSVSGHIHFVPLLEDPLGPLRAGRFGWKSQVATVLSFSGDAALNEMGITNALVPTENAPNGDPMLLMACDTVADPEDVPDGLGLTFVQRITHFQRFLAPPPQTPRSGMAGEALFASIGCADCHTPSYTTGPAPEAALAGKLIRPYSDFLVHDMGLLGDGIVQGTALETELRTTPLWGVRWRDPLLHDGRIGAGTVTSRLLGAIQEHDGEAAFAKGNFNALPGDQQAQVLAFLDSLGRHEFDHNDDIFIDHSDFLDFWACFSGPGSHYTADDPCAIHDVDQDGDVDEDDFTVFLSVYEGSLVDCNANSIPDMIELVQGTASDCNRNGVPDTCELDPGTDANANGVLDECETFRRGDCNDSGAVDISDAVFALTYLFQAGSRAPVCDDACDNNDDGVHDIADPISLLSYLFGMNGPAPPAPFPNCGFDGTPGDTLPCAPTVFCP